MEEKRKLKLILFSFIFLLVCGVFGYMVLLKVDFIDALYMTVITISTVGFREVGTTSAASEIFSVFMIFLGVGIVGYTFTTVVAMFVEGKLGDFWKGNKKYFSKELRIYANYNCFDFFSYKVIRRVA